MSKCLCHKSPKDKAVFQLIRDFIVSTSALGMPPPYIKSSPKSRVVPTGYDKNNKKVTFCRTNLRVFRTAP